MSMTQGEIAQAIREFCSARDWDQFHGPKDLAIGMVTEASELLEHFRFQTDDQSEALVRGGVGREGVEEELADVYFFLLRFCDRFGIDPNAALARKLEKNALKYPVEKSRGKNQKYTEL
jgi:NTP pyrophosphatase (non-canonical NTP hydrolase)